MPSSILIGFRTSPEQNKSQRTSSPTPTELVGCMVFLPFCRMSV